MPEYKAQEERSDSGYSHGRIERSGEPVLLHKKRRVNTNPPPRRQPAPEPEPDKEEPEMDDEEDIEESAERGGANLPRVPAKRLVGRSASWTTQRRPPQRAPNYKLHVVAALSVTIIITFLAGGKDIVSALSRVQGK
jgi:hypothetical protein